MKGSAPAPGAPPMRKKMVHSIDTAYSAVQWPEIANDDQDVILELLCNLLSPIGQHRQNTPPSKGQRSKKRKREAEKQARPHEEVEASKPPIPQIAAFVDVGLSSITKHLQELISKAPEAGGDTTNHDSQHYALIFVARSGQPPAFSSHFPQMVAVASKHSANGEPIRLIGYSKHCSDRLSASLGIPRVSSVGVRYGAPVAQALNDYVRDHVPPVRISWLEDAESARYRQSRITSEEKTVPLKKTVKK